MKTYEELTKENEQLKADLLKLTAMRETAARAVELENENQKMFNQHTNLVSQLFEEKNKRLNAVSFIDANPKIRNRQNNELINQLIKILL